MKRPLPRLLLCVALPALAASCADTPTSAPPPTPPEAIPEVTWDVDDVARFARADGFVISPRLDATQGATRVGALVTLELPHRDVPRFEVRGYDEDGGPLAWIPLETTWAEADQLVLRADFEEVVHSVELRVTEDDAYFLGLVTLSALVPEPTVELPEVGAARAYLRSELATAGVRSRADWGARATRCSSNDPSKHRIAIHHTVTPSDGDPAVRLRGIQAYHMDSRGWCDVGYHFLVTVDGQVWEGRPMNLLGSHVGGHNTGNIGVSFVGCFHSSSCSAYPPNVPPDAMIGGASSAVRVLADLHGITMNTTTVKGHRDHAGASTSCPGDHLHSRLGEIRAGTPVVAELAASYVDQSFPLARDPFEVPAGETVSGYIEMRNDGSETWRPGETFLGTTQPRDAASPIAGPDWISDNRAATVDRVVAPGETGRFAFTVQAPRETGSYPQFFSLVQEGVAWFSDPGQGGPPDDLLQVRVTSTPAPTGPEPDAGVEADAGVDGGAPDGSVPTGDAEPVVEGAGATTSGHIRGGCSAARTGGELPASLAALMVLLARSRRRPGQGKRQRRG